MRKFMMVAVAIIATLVCVGHGLAIDAKSVTETLWVFGTTDLTSVQGKEDQAAAIAAIEKAVEGFQGTIDLQVINVKDRAKSGWLTLRVDNPPKSSARIPRPGLGAAYCAAFAEGKLVIVYENKSLGWWSHSEVLNLDPEDPDQGPDQVTKLVTKSRTRLAKVEVAKH